MTKNSKKTSKKVASEAAKTLRDPSASALQKSLAGSALSQVDEAKQTSGQMESKAGKALDNPRSAKKTKKLAGSVTSQSNKKRKSK